jgi:hypothetical protein
LLLRQLRISSSATRAAVCIVFICDDRSVALTRALACVLVVTAVGCGGGDGDRASATTPRPTTTPTDSRPEPVVAEDALLGVITAWSGSVGTILAPVDRRTLKPGVPWARLGEYHDAWSLSPDHELAAFGISAPGENGRIGIRVIDLGTFQVVRDIDTGIAAEALGWIAPDRLVAFLQSGEVAVVDPHSGVELSRDGLGAISCPFAPPHAVTPVGFLMVVTVAGTARVVLVDAASRVQIARLDDIGLGETFGLCQSAGLAVDPARLVAYVFGADAPVAAVDLRTMHVRRHRVTGAPALTRSGCRACGAQRSAVWLGGGRFAVAGSRLRPGRAHHARQTPIGTAVIDTRDWTARMIAARAGAVRLAGDRTARSVAGRRAAAPAGDRLLVYDGRHPSIRPRAGAGLRVHDRAGRFRYTVLGGARVGDVQVSGARAYARTGHGLRVIDLRRGAVIARLPRVRRDVDLIAPR